MAKGTEFKKPLDSLILHCDKCSEKFGRPTWNEHILSVSGTKYICTTCANLIEYHRNEAPEGTAYAK